jgi:hypothetical protein
LALLLRYQFQFEECTGEAGMALLILKVLVMWSLLSTMTGFSLGAVIRRGERIRRDEILAYVFAAVQALQAART